MNGRDVNPLNLLRALSIAAQRMGGTIRNDTYVVEIEASNTDFTAL